jgi:hypothetical protein
MFWLTGPDHECPMPGCSSILSVGPDDTDREVGNVIWDSGWFVQDGHLVCPRHGPPTYDEAPA